MALEKQDGVAPYQPSMSYILQYLQERSVFLVLPHSSTYPESPRQLPREVYVDRGRIAATLDPSVIKKKGRPSKNDRTRKTLTVLGTLESWLDATESLPTHASSNPTSATLGSKEAEYRLFKSQVFETIDGGETSSEGRAAVSKANELVLQRLKEIRDLMPEDAQEEDDKAGVGRIERAVGGLQSGQNRGILDLVDGAGVL